MNLSTEKDRKNIALKDEDPGMETISVGSSNYGKHGIWDGSKGTPEAPRRASGLSCNSNTEEEDQQAEETRHSDLDSLVDCSRSRAALGSNSNVSCPVRRMSSRRLSDKHLAELDISATLRQERRVSALRKSHTKAKEEQEGAPQVGSIDFYRLRLGLELVAMDCSSASAPASTESQARLRSALQKKILNTGTAKRSSSRRSSSGPPSLVAESNLKRRGSRLPPKSHSLDSGRALAFQLGKDQCPQMPLRCASRRELASLASQMVQAEQAAAKFRAPDRAELSKKKKRQADASPKKTAQEQQQDEHHKDVPREIEVTTPSCQPKAELKPAATPQPKTEAKPAASVTPTAKEVAPAAPVLAAAKHQNRIYAAQLEVAAVAAIKAEEASAGSLRQLSRGSSVKKIASGSFRLLKKSLSRTKMPAVAYAQIDSEEEEEEEEEEELDLSGKLSRSLPWGLKCVEVPARNPSGCDDEVSVCSSVSMDSEGEEDSDGGMTSDEEEEQSVTEGLVGADTKADLNASLRLRRRSSRRSQDRRRRSRSRRRRRRRSGMHQSYSSSGSRSKSSRRRRSSRRERGEGGDSRSKKQLSTPSVPAAAAAAALGPTKIRRVANAQA